MKIKSSLDWPEVKTELITQAAIVIHYPEISKIIRNLDNEIKRLGNEEIHARITGHDRRAKEMVDAINNIIETLENHLLLESLSR